MNELLARLLRESGQDELAINYLEKALDSNPRSVPLLAAMGRYLFEDERDDAARTFLMRAEAISPRHPALREAKAHIARLLNLRR